MNKEIGKGVPLLVLAYLLGVIPGLWGEEPPKEKPYSISRYVKVIASAGKVDADGKQELTVTLKIDPTCYVIANPVGEKELEGTEITMEVKAGGKPVRAEITYPPGVNLKNKLVPNLKIYREVAVIRATVHRTPGDTGSLEVTLRMDGQIFGGEY